MMIRYLLKDYTKHKNIFCNIHIKNIPYQQLFIEDLLDPEKNEYIKNATIGIDEITLFMDCRSSIKNKFLSYVFLQSRKRHTNFYCTTQDDSMVDFRLTRFVRIFVFARVIYDKYNEPLKDYRQFDIIDIRNRYNIKRNNIILDVRPYFKYYDTDEILRPIMKENKHVR